MRVHVAWAPGALPNDLAPPGWVQVSLKKAVALSVRSACTRLETAIMTVATQLENMETAREGLRIAREGYRAGVIKNADLLAAELSLTGTRSGYIKAVHDYYVILAELEMVVGVDSLDMTDKEKADER